MSTLYGREGGGGSLPSERSHSYTSGSLDAVMPVECPRTAPEKPSWSLPAHLGGRVRLVRGE